MNLTVILQGICKAATVLSVLMKVFTIPCHDRGHINVVLVLQSCSNSLHIVPGSSSETHATSGGVCNFGNTDVEEDVDEIEEVFMSINKEVYRGIKQEEIPGHMSFPDIKSEPDTVSYVCYWTHFTSVRESYFFCDVSISSRLKQLHCWK